MEVNKIRKIKLQNWKKNDTFTHYENAQTQGINYVLIPNYGLLCNHANSYTDSKKPHWYFF